MPTVLLIALAAAGQIDPHSENLAPVVRAAELPSHPPLAASDTLVVCPPSWLASLRPWLEHREEQGHRLAVHTDPLTRDGITKAILRTASRGQLKYVVLVGDVDWHWGGTSAIRLPGVPTHFVPATVNVHWGSERMLVTDQQFADPDQNGVPDMAVGRLSVDSRDELDALIDKILRYETTVPCGDWQRRIQFVAGSGDFGPLVDTVIETTARSFITEGIPAGYHASLAYANWRSPYCPNPFRFPRVAADGMNSGCLFWVYLGHGSPHQLGQIQLGDAAHRRLPIFTQEHATTVAARNGLPVALLWACYAGAYDHPQDCLAEALLRQSRGPVAVLAGSRVTMPYGMAALGSGLLQAIFEEQRTVLGDAILRAQHLALAEATESDKLDADTVPAVSNNATKRRSLDTLARAISPAKDQLQVERREHVQMFNLLGDPLLRLAVPHPLRLRTDEHTQAGSTLHVQVVVPFAGEALIELVCRRDRNKARLTHRRQFDDSPDGLAAMDRTYQLANDGVWVMRRQPVRAGLLETELQTPADCRGPCHVRILLKSADRVAVGAAEVYVRRASATASLQD